MGENDKGYYGNFLKFENYSLNYGYDYKEENQFKNNLNELDNSSAKEIVISELNKIGNEQESKIAKTVDENSEKNPVNENEYDDLDPNTNEREEAENWKSFNEIEEINKIAELSDEIITNFELSKSLNEYWNEIEEK